MRLLILVALIGLSLNSLIDKPCWCFAGVATALQFPLEYQYKYEGRVDTSIPGIHPTTSALGIKALVTIQVRSPKQAVAKLSEVLVGNMNEEVRSTFLKQPLPINYRQFPGRQQHQIEKSFTVNFQQDKGNVMDVSADEPTWITNIKKSIIEIFLVQPIRFSDTSLPSDSIFRSMRLSETPASFSIEEESMFGRCESQYTISRLPQTASQEAEKSIRNTIMEDIQSSSSQSYRTKHLPKIEDKLWRLTRSISFDKCHERVLYQHSTMGNTSKAGSGQFDSIQSRSSVGTFLIRGKPGQFRIESAIVEGNIIRKPFGIKSETIQANTNQTLKLVSAREVTGSFPIPQPSKAVKTWNFEIESPFSPPFGGQKPFVKYMAKGDAYTPVSPLGILMGTQGEQAELKASLEHQITSAAEELSKMPGRPPQTPSITKNEISSPTTRLHAAANIFQSMHLNKIRDTFSYFFGRRGHKAEIEQALLVDAAAASGSSAPMKVILEKIISGSISSTRAASIFTTLTSQLSSPSIIQDILTYIKSIEIEESPYLASAALINFARMARRACYSQGSRNYSMPNAVYGSEACKPSVITNEFVPHLEKLLTRSAKSRDKAIVIQAFSELGSIKTFPTLVEAALGKHGSSPRVRTTAIYALAGNKFPRSMKQKILDVLMEIAENLGELSEVRQASIAVIPSLRPDVAVYQRLARNTWKEGSKSTAAFIYFTLKSVSELKGPGRESQASKAAFATSIAKPFSPSSYYSLNYRTSSYIPEQQISSEFEFAYLVNMRSIVPKQLYISLTNSFGGFNVSPFQAAVFAQGIDTYIPQMFDIIHSSESESYSKSRSFHPRNTKSKERQIYEEMKKLSQQIPIYSEPEFSIFIKVLDNIITYAPFDSSLIEQIAGKGGIDFIKSIKQGARYNINKFANPIQNNYCIPTEIGLPLIGSFEMPIVIHASGDIKLNSQGPNEQSISELYRSNKTSFSISSHFRFIQQFKAKLQVFSPWDSKKTEVGVDNVRAFNLPIYTNITYSHSGSKSNYTINFSPSSRHEVPIVYTHNIPYTAIKPIVKLPDVLDSRSSIILSLKGDQTPSVDISDEGSCQYTGFSGSISYLGDIPNPFTAGNTLEFIRKPAKIGELFTSPNTRLYRTFATLDSASSSTQNISFSYSHETKYSSLRSFQSQSTPSKIPSPHDFKERLTKGPMSESDISVPVYEFKFMTNGSEYRQAEATIMFSESHSEFSQSSSSRRSGSQSGSTPGHKEYRIISSGKVSSFPGINTSGKHFTFKAIATTPNITTFSTLQTALQEEEMASKISAIITTSQSQQPAIAFEAKTTLSEQRKNIILEELKDSSSYDESTPTTRFQVPAIYDKGEAKIIFQKKQISSSVINATYYFDETFKGHQHPHVSVNKMNVENPDDEISIQFSRSIAEPTYQVYVKKPTENVNFDKVNIGSSLSIIPISGLKTSSQSSSSALLSGMATSTCKISKEEIKPFNKQSYPFQPTKCYTTAVETPSNKGNWAIQFRETPEGQMKLKIYSTTKGITIKISSTEVRVNGQEISIPSTYPYQVKDERDKAVAQILELPGGLYYALVGSKYIVRLHRNTIRIYGLKAHERLIGVCGTSDSYEMVGPKGCIYNQQNTYLMKYAFSYKKGSGCNEQDFHQKQKQVKEYQSTCTKKTEYLSGVPVSIFQRKECDEFSYRVKRDGKGNYCVSSKPTRKCSRGCYSHHPIDIKVSAKCWPSEDAPEEVKKAAEIGHISHPVHEYPFYYTDMTMRVPTRCTSG